MRVKHGRKNCRAVTFGFASGLDRGEQPCHPFTVYIEEQVDLRRVMVINPPLGCTESARYVVDTGGMVALLHKALGRDQKNFLLAWSHTQSHG